uniref:Solute carrier family 37 member 2 n=1 Tax=Coturnix japonica TaxID=93934 RepID=A0A8C2SZ18_COTJA
MDKGGCLLQIRTTTRSFSALWTMPSSWHTPLGCSSGTGAVLSSPSPAPRPPSGTTPLFPMFSPQWHFWGAAAPAVLPVGGHVAERDLHSTLWLWLLLEYPRAVVLHHCAGAARPRPNFGIPSLLSVGADTARPVWQALPGHALGLLPCFLLLRKVPTFGCLLSPCQVCNGLAQTTGWPSVVACVGNWFGKGKRGLIMGIWNSHTSVGNILGSLIAGAWVSSQWGLSFIVPGIIIAVVGIVCFFFLVEHPEDVGCSPPLQHDTSDEKDPEGVTSEDRSTTDPKELNEELEAISFLGALRIPGVVEFSLCLLFAKLVSYTFLYWLPLYIVNVAHFGAKEAGDLSTLFDVGGILGGIFAGLISDYTGGRATTCCVMLVVAAPMLFLYNHVGQNGIGTSIAMLIVCGALVNGPYALITTAVSADLGTHESLKGNAKALSTVTAIIDGTGSVGAALGPLLAGLISPTGWNNVFYMLIAADVLACLLLARVVVKEVRAWYGCMARKRGFQQF